MQQSGVLGESQSQYKRNNYTDVMIGIPTNGRKVYCFGEFIEGLERLIAYTESHGVDVDVLFTDDTEGHDNLKEMVSDIGYRIIKLPPKKVPDVNFKRVNARNAIRDEFKKSENQHLFWLDSDIIAPEEIIVRLLTHNKDIVAGVYWNKTPNGPLPLVFDYSTDACRKKRMWQITRQLILPDLLPSRLMSVVYVPMGNSLISRKVMEKVGFYWKEGQKTDESVNFFTDCLKAGFEVFVDTAMNSKHMWEEF